MPVIWVYSSIILLQIHVHVEGFHVDLFVKPQTQRFLTLIFYYIYTKSQLTRSSYALYIHPELD